MLAHWRRGCLGLLLGLFGILLVIVVLAGAGVLIGARQPGELWSIPLARGYFAIGRIVGSADCRRLLARGRPCARRYGAVLYLAGVGADGHGAEYTLFAFDDPF
jgi:hypothetical protein